MKKAYKQPYLDLKQAVTDLYQAALWTSDRPVPNADKLWENLRKAAGLQPENSPRSIDTNAKVATNDKKI